MMYRQGRVVTQDYKEAVEMIRERVIAGLERAKAKGVKLGRRRISEDRVHKIRQLREQGWGMNKISRELRVGSATVQKICKS
jgi:DNA invertase Pin-like site-specific DNA recombinase